MRKLRERANQIVSDKIPIGKIGPILLGSFALFYSSYLAYTVITASPEFRVQFVPDDAYYYMTLARNFVIHGQWTFDSGASLTSGFHLLHAYVLAAVYAVTRASAEQLIGISIFISFLGSLSVIAAVVVFTVRKGRLLPSLLLLQFVLSRNVSVNLLSAMEWGWVVFLSALYCFSFWQSDGSRRRVHFLALFVLGFFGSLSRTDFGLLPAALFLASLPSAYARDGRIRVSAAFSGLIGASAGVAAVFLHNYVTTGQYLQSSARMKSLWLGAQGASAAPIVSKVLTLFGEMSLTTLLLSALLALCAFALGIRHFLGVWFLRENYEALATTSNEARNAALWFGSLFAITGYTAFYSFNSAGIQHWYTANFIVPIFLAIGLPLFNIRLKHPACLSALALVAVLIGRQVPLACSFLGHPEWPHQISMYRAGNFLHSNARQGRTGSWNAGIIGFYEGGHVINLDGLVNNDIYKYARKNTLAEYIDSKKIKYVVDFQNMFSSEERQRQGGYRSIVFLRRLKAIRLFDNRSSGWSRLTLFMIIPAGAPVTE